MTEAKKRGKEEDKKNDKAATPSLEDRLYLLCATLCLDTCSCRSPRRGPSPSPAKRSNATHKSSSPWRAAVPWWYSVSQVKFEDPTLPACTARIRGKLYAFPQVAGKIPNAELRQFCEKQVGAEREKRKEEFVRDFRGTIWMTYRKGFEGLQAAGVPKAHQHTSDTGWGCMIRGGQMLLANCVLRHLFGPGGFSVPLVDSDKDARVKYLSLLWQ